MCSTALLLSAVFVTAACGQAPTDGSALLQGGPVGQAATPAPVKSPVPAQAPVPAPPPIALPGYGASTVRIPIVTSYSRNCIISKNDHVVSQQLLQQT